MLQRGVVPDSISNANTSFSEDGQSDHDPTTSTSAATSKSVSANLNGFGSVSKADQEKGTENRNIALERPSMSGKQSESSTSEVVGENSNSSENGSEERRNSSDRLVITQKRKPNNYS